MKILKKWNTTALNAATVSLSSRRGNCIYPYRVEANDLNDKIVGNSLDFKAKTYKRLLCFLRNEGPENVQQKLLWLSPLSICVDFREQKTAEIFCEMIAALGAGDFSDSHKLPILACIDSPVLVEYSCQIAEFLARQEEMVEQLKEQSKLLPNVDLRSVVTYEN